MNLSKKINLSISLPLFVCLLCTMISSCGNGSHQVEPTEVDLRTFRMDRPIFETEAKDLQLLHEKLSIEQRNFYPDYFKEVLQLGEINDPRAGQLLHSFQQFELSRLAQERIEVVFPDVDELEAGFKGAFGRLKTLYPHRNTPQLVFMNSAYNFGVVPSESALAIGLEFYLGKDDPVIAKLPGQKFPQYVREKMIPEQVLSNGVRGWLLVRNQPYLEGGRLIDHVAHYGRIMYLLHMLLPEEPEHRLFAYTAEELAWSQENEFEIWKTMVSNEMVFSKDRKLIRDWTGNGPFTQGFAKDSPAQLAYFVGKEMVDDYMAENDHLTIDQLWEIDAEEIMAAYRPQN